MDAESTVRDAWRSIAGSHHDDVVERVLARHREPHRHHHTARHLAAVIGHLHALSDDDVAPPIVAAAIFHDVVYDPRSSTNEADSADIAVDELRGLGWAVDRRDDVRRLIHATARHDAAAVDEALLLDADLAILGAPPDDYDRYAAAVRLEYAHVRDDEWSVGRAAVLRSFLDRRAIFHTEQMRSSREETARLNLRRELAALQPLDQR